LTIHYSPTDKHDKRNCAAVLVEEEFSLFEATIEPAACRYTVLRWVHHTVFGIRKENSLGPRTGPLPLSLSSSSRDVIYYMDVDTFRSGR